MRTSAYHTYAMIPLKINVQVLLTDLGAQMSDAKIGLEVQAPAQTIGRLRRGKHKSTDLERGIRIARFHARVFGNTEWTEWLNPANHRSN